MGGEEKGEGAGGDVWACFLSEIAKLESESIS